MNLKLLSALAALPMVALAGVAVADEAGPMALDEQQLDDVTASGFAEVFADAFAIGATASTFTYGLAEVEVVAVEPLQVGAISLVSSYSDGAAQSLSDF